jgi:hypothetical protein
MINARRRENYARKKAARGAALLAIGVPTHTNGEFYIMVDYMFSEFLNIGKYIYLQCKLCWSYIHQQDPSNLNMDLLLNMTWVLTKPNILADPIRKKTKEHHV